MDIQPMAQLQWHDDYYRLFVSSSKWVGVKGTLLEPVLLLAQATSLSCWTLMGRLIQAKYHVLLRRLSWEMISLKVHAFFKVVEVTILLRCAGVVTTLCAGSSTYSSGHALVTCAMATTPFGSTASTA